VRIINSAIAIVLLVLIVMFAVQNTGAVTIQLIGASITAPLALIAIGAYILGMLTGTTIFSALRRPLRERKGS